jgi:hypothetical protein
MHAPIYTANLRKGWLQTVLFSIPEVFLGRTNVGCVLAEDARLI